MMSTPRSIREAQQTDLHGPSLYKDHAHHSLVPTIGVSQGSESVSSVFPLLLDRIYLSQTLLSLAGVLPSVWLMARGCPQTRLTYAWDLEVSSKSTLS